MKVPLKWKEELQIGNTLKVMLPEGPESALQICEIKVTGLRKDKKRHHEDELLIEYTVIDDE